MVELALDPSSSRSKPKTPPWNLDRSPLLVGSRRKKTDRGQDQLFFSSQKPPGSCLCFSRTKVLHSSGSSTIGLPFVLAEYVACSPDRTCYRTLARVAAPYRAFRDSATYLPLECHFLPKGAKLALGKRRSGGYHPQPTKPPPRLNRPAESRRQPDTHTPKTAGFGGSGRLFVCA